MAKSSSFGAVKRLRSLIEKSATDLRNEILAMGLNPEGKSTDQMEDMLAMAHWAKKHPNEPFPDQYNPMLAHDATTNSEDWFRKTIKSTDWWLQVKKNGMRSLLQIKNGKVSATSRNRSDATEYRYGEHQENVLGFQDLKDPFKGKTVLDGELMSPSKRLDTGTVITSSELQAVVALIHMEKEASLALQKKVGSLTYHAFDILFYNGEDVRGKRYDERSDILEKAVQEIKAANPHAPIFFEPVVKEYDDPVKVFKDKTDSGEEGIMLKKRSGTYRMGARSKELLKMKRTMTTDGWISGFVPSSEGKGQSHLIGGFEISAYVDGKEQVIAAVSGIDVPTKTAATITGPDGKPALNPEFLNKVLQVTGQEWTKNNRLVHARFDEWRPDKRKEDCQLKSEDMYQPA